MATQTKNFTGISEGPKLYLRRNESLTYAVTGTFVGNLILEYTHNGGQTWVRQESISTVGTKVVKGVTSSSQTAHYRFRCDSFTSGTIETSIADVSDFFKSIKNLKGFDLMKLFDDSVDVDGNLNVSGSVKQADLALITSAERTVYIYEESDFPAAVAGLITLADNTTYRLMNSIVMANRFKAPTTVGSNTNIYGDSFNHQTITYTGSGVFMDASGVTFLNFFNVSIFNTGGGTFLNTSPAAFPFSQVSLNNVLISGFTSLGTWTTRAFINDCAFLDNGGLILNDQVDMRIQSALMLNQVDNGATYITLGGSGTFTGKIEGLTVTSQATETALKITNTIAGDSLMRIQGNSFRGAGTVLDASGLDQKDIRVLSNDNDGLADSRTIGSFVSQGNDVATVISTIGEGESNYVDLDLGESSGSITVYATNGAGGTTVTSTSHGEPDEKLIEISGSTSYDGKHEIFNVTTHTFDIDVAFVADDGASTWTSGAFADDDIERWELNDASNGELKYIGNSPISGEFMATISAVAVGGAAKRYKFRIVKNGIDGFAIPNEIKNAITETTLRKGFTAVKNDLFKIQVANFADTSNIIIDTVSVGIR